MSILTFIQSRSARRDTRRLNRLGTMSYWSWRSRRRQGRLGWSRLLFALRDWIDQVRQDGSLLAQLTFNAVSTGIVTMVLLLGLEAIAAVFNGHNVAWARGFDGHAAPERYEVFVAAAVGAQATFLALFFTTVGVIAATAYANVPGEIRQLFVAERGSRLYIANVVRALVFGVAILSMRVIDHQPHVLTVLSLTVLTVFSVLSLAALGTGLFNFFDLSSLATPLPGRLRRAVGAATARRSAAPGEALQQASHERARAVLSIYGQLNMLLSQRAGGEARAPLKLTYQMLGDWLQYAHRKSAIPIGSQWFGRVPAHQNWLTADHDRLQMALATQTGMRAELVADPLWVERELAHHLATLFPLLTAGNGWATAISVADQANQVIEILAHQLQLDEALLLRATMTSQLHAAESAAPAGGEGEAPSFSVASATKRTFTLAAAERGVLTLTSAWLGVARAAEQLAVPDRLVRAWDAGVAGLTAPYRTAAPRELLTVLEQIAAGIAFERRTEGKQITPPWWVHHIAARALSRHLQSAAARLFVEAERGVVGPIEAAADQDPERTVVQVFSALELTDKLATHLPTIRRAVDTLETFRHSSAGDDRWVAPSLPTNQPANLEDRLLMQLGRTILDLQVRPYDSTSPDLFGRAYKVLFEGTFQAILGGRDDLAGALFPVVMAAADRARSRLVGDLADQRPLEQFAFGTEPWIDLMEISGYALIMTELDGRGIWPQVKAEWDSLMARDTGPALAAQLATILVAREALHAVTQGGLDRTARRMRLERMLRSRRIADQDGPPFMRDPGPTHSSPVVAAFAPGWMGHHDLEDLFVVEYLLSRLEAAGIGVPHGVQALRDQLVFDRQRAAEASSDTAEIIAKPAKAVSEREERGG